MFIAVTSISKGNSWLTRKIRSTTTSTQLPKKRRRQQARQWIKGNRPPRASARRSKTPGKKSKIRVSESGALEKKVASFRRGGTTFLFFNCRDESRQHRIQASD